MNCKPKEALFHLPDLPKYHLCLIPSDLIVSSFHWQMWCYLCHRSDCKRLKEKTKRDLRKVSMLKNVVISVWTHNKRFSKVGNMTCTKNCLKKNQFRQNSIRCSSRITVQESCLKQIFCSCVIFYSKITFISK